MSENIKQINQQTGKSKVSLLLLIIALVILAFVSGYVVYVININSITNISENEMNPVNTTVTNQVVNNQPDETVSIPDGWEEHDLSECDIKIYLPQNWSLEELSMFDSGIYSVISNSPERSEDLKKIGEGYPSLQIICYDNIKDMVNLSSNAESVIDTPSTLEEALNIKNPYSDVFYNIFDFGSKPEKITLNNQTGFQGLQGGFGVTLNRYFEHDGKIIEIRTDNFNQDTLELYTTDRQIQELIKFID